MSLSELFIRRPVATSLLAIGLCLAGLLAWGQLAVAPLPQVDYPTIVVTTQLPGASAETMATAVTTPLERQFGQMPSLAEMTSVSGLGTSVITLQFTLDRSIDAAEQDVQAAINAASALLPPTLPMPPTYSKSNPADQPVLTFSVSSETLSQNQVNDFADSILAQKISQVPGVGLVTLGGGQRPAVRVQVDPVALAGRGLTLEDIRLALAASNVRQPVGDLSGPRQNFTLTTNDQLPDAPAFRPLVIAYRNGAAIRLREVARVTDGVENAERAGFANGRPAVLVDVQRQPGANIIEVVDRIKALLPQLRAAMPQGLEVAVVSDRTETIRASVEDVQFTLVLTVALVVLVIFVFLRNVRATLVPGVAVPLSLVGTFGVMYLLGFSLNNLSLMALTISTGFVVDDAIVMVENIARYIEHGDSPFEAALKGAKQIGFTIVSLTVSLVAVLIPLLFMGGIVGRLFREFAVTLAAAIVLSAVLSLTVTPMMAGHVLRAEPPPDQRGRVYHALERGFDASVRLYDALLVRVLRHPWLTLLATLATVAATVLLAVAVPKGFFPEQDTGLLAGSVEVTAGASFARVTEQARAAADVIRRDPDVASVMLALGAEPSNPAANSARLTVALKPRAGVWGHGGPQAGAERPQYRRASARAILARVRAQLAQLAGVEVYLAPVQDLTLDVRPSRTPYQYTLEDADPVELAEWAPRMMAAMRRLPELREVASDAQNGGRALEVTVDRDTAARLGLSAQNIDDTLYDAFGQRQVSIIFTPLNQYRVVLEVLPELAQDPAALGRLYARAQNGAQVPLSAFCTMRVNSAPLVVNHEGLFPSVTLSFDLAPGASLGRAVTAIDAARERVGLPPTVRARYAGMAQEFQRALAGEGLLVLAALLTVYIVLGVLYESLVHPVTILSTLPSAGVGAFLALLVTGGEFDVIALIGIVLLIGIVKKNAIMMIDFALEAERDEGLSPAEAIHRACLLRFRPIMMTTLAALLGGIPLAVGQGPGSELRRPLGITIVGGLIVSQLLTLFTTPVIYLFMEQLRGKIAKLRGAPTSRPPPLPSGDAPVPEPAGGGALP